MTAAVNVQPYPFSERAVRGGDQIAAAPAVIDSRRSGARPNHLDDMIPRALVTSDPARVLKESPTAEWSASSPFRTTSWFAGRANSSRTCAENG